ncbi:MAG: M24 family metallopeptidase [Pyrinomonadaceae bacterium]
MAKKTEIAEKTARITRMLAEESLAGVLISAQHNFSWLTAGGRSGIDLSREVGAAALLVRADGKRFVLANRIEMSRLLAEEVSDEDFEPVEFSWEEEKASPSFMVDLGLRLLSAGGALGSDLPSSNATTIEGALARCRYQLTASEIERYRLLGSDAGLAIDSLARSLEPGLTELEIARRASDALAARHARPVVALVAADERIKRFRHPVPGDRAWKKSVMVVVCARREGLIASLTRVVFVGSIPDELRHRTLAAARVNAELYSATRPGVSGSDLYRVAARAYEQEGFLREEQLHHQGGACGYRTRDWVAHPLCTETVQVNQGFAWNPSVTGAKVEETCIASAEGIEVITASAGWPQITLTVDGREYSSPDVLSL